MKISERISTGFISAVLGFLIFILIQFILVVKVLPKHSNIEIFLDFRYAIIFSMTLFLVGFLLGSKRMARVLGFIFRTNR